VTSLQGNASSSEAPWQPSLEPLLWVQLIGLAAWPLEGLALLLLLAGGDPGPFPLVERLFCWGLGTLLPALLFWRLPPDLWSLLLLQVPLRGRSERQRRLSALQASLGLRFVAAAGSLPLLALVWWADRQGGIAWSLSPLAASPRLVVLLVCAPLLALMLWQWQQLVQAIWLLSRPIALIESTAPLGLDQARHQRLNLGLPLLLLPALSDPRPGRMHPPEASSTPATPPTNELTPAGHQAADPDQPEATLPPEPRINAESPAQPAEAELPRAPKNPPAPAEEIASAPIAPIGDLSAAVPMAIEDQQTAEDGQGGELDQQI
jgi:hypothetical protein